MKARAALVVLTSALALAPLSAAAAEVPAPPSDPPSALFALIVGVNASASPERAPLRYADDDAARYLDLFRALGARSTLLARLDANTRVLHPQAAAEAQPPRLREVRAAVDALARDIAQARSRGVKSTLYVIYAGHGEAREAGVFLTLEDGVLSEGQLLHDVVDRAAADQSHLIVDACNAYLLALPRGPGGDRRPFKGFVELAAAARAGHTGYLLSTSSSGEAHEWAGFEAGVFSHEVRSGLYGAADADGDGRVSYSEIAAFVHRANAAIASERFRPQVLARPPRDGDVLLDLRPRRGTELRFGGDERGAHYLLEDAQGVRLLDFHPTAAAPVHLVRPPGQGALYLRRVADGAERLVPRTDGVVELDRIPVAPARSAARGAVHEAFGKLFALPFDAQAVLVWQRERADVEARAESQAAARADLQRRDQLRRTAGWTALAVGGAAAIAAGALELSAYRLRTGAPPGEDQRSAVARNDQIGTRNQVALGLSIAGGAAIATGVLLLLWPRRAEPALDLGIALTPNQTEVAARWRF
jgi:hypothetical protein